MVGAEFCDFFHDGWDLHIGVQKSVWYVPRGVDYRPQDFILKSVKDFDV